MSKLRLHSRASRLAAAGLAQSSFEIRCMPVSDLHCPVRDVPAFADQVAASIAREGLANPIIVVRGPREDLAAELDAMGGTGSQLPDTPVVNCVYGGTNRITAAKSLGHTHVDCVLLPNFMLGRQLQDLQRNSYSDGTATESVGQ